MSTWTFAFDESGRFEGRHIAEERDEQLGFVLGGILAPGDAQTLDGAWRKRLMRRCRELGTSFPPHANELSQEVREELLRVAADAIRKSGGTWLFIVDGAQSGGSLEAWTRYVRMLGQAVEFAGRVAAAQGAKGLEVRPAQRTVPGELSDTTQLSGLPVTLRDGESGIRADSGREVRRSLEALRRTDVGWLGPFPDLASPVEVLSAGSQAAHAGLALADLGCNAVFRGLRSAEAMAATASVLGEALIVPREMVRTVTQVDVALRDTPPDLVRAARAVAALEGHGRGTATDALRPAAGVAATRVWEGGLRALERRLRSAPTLARALAAQVEAVLTVKSGAYEGVWRALDAGWCGDSPLADAVRAEAPREVAAMLWRCTLECANHRGDTRNARRASAEVKPLFEGARSFRLLVERQQFRNLEVVALQNGFLAEESQVAELREALATATEDLAAAAELAGDLAELAFPSTAAVILVPDEEEALWRAFGKEARFEPTNLERGGQYGTVGRSHAFLGDLDAAVDALFVARSLFGGSDFDLGFNAAILARVELERARLGQGRPEPLGAALAAAGIDAVRRPKRLRELLPRQPGRRFTLDLLLRALLWAPEAAGVEPGVWHLSLADERIYAALATGELRSHPTELIARHAGELLLEVDRKAAERWFELSLALSAEAPDGTMRAMARATRLLGDNDSEMGTGTPGSLTNPTFEYR
jgi:hypothetical protein